MQWLLYVQTEFARHHHVKNSAGRESTMKKYLLLALGLLIQTAHADVIKTLTFKCTARVVDVQDKSKILGYYCPNSQLHIAYNHCEKTMPDKCQSYSVIEDQLPLWRPEFTSKTPIEKTITYHLPDNVTNYSVFMEQEPVSPNSVSRVCILPFAGKSVFEWTGEGNMYSPTLPQQVWGKCIAY